MKKSSSALRTLFCAQKHQKCLKKQYKNAAKTNLEQNGILQNLSLYEPLKRQAANMALPYFVKQFKRSLKSLMLQHLEQNFKQFKTAVQLPCMQTYAPRRAFSLVEMLMALLIASLLLAALAPVMTKKFSENINVTGNIGTAETARKTQEIEFGSADCADIKIDTDGSEYCEGEFEVPGNKFNGYIKATVISAGGGGGTAPTAGFTEYTTAGSTNTFTVPAMTGNIEATLISGGAGGGAGGQKLTDVDFKTQGETSWSVPAIAQNKNVLVTACGGGGGAGGGGAGGCAQAASGGSGGYVQNVPMTIPSTIYIKIPGGGGGGGGGGGPNNGGFYSGGGGGGWTHAGAAGGAYGGKGGNGAIGANGGSGGNGTIGTVFANGSGGSHGNNGNNYAGGGGRGTVWAGGGGGGTSWTKDNGGSGTGGGGGGPTTITNAAGTNENSIIFQIGGGGGGGGGNIDYGIPAGGGGGGGGGYGAGGGGGGGGFNGLGGGGGGVGYKTSTIGKGSGKSGLSATRINSSSASGFCTGGSSNCSAGGGGGGGYGGANGASNASYLCSAVSGGKISTIFGENYCNGGDTWNDWTGNNGKPGALRISYLTHGPGGSGGGAAHIVPIQKINVVQNEALSVKIGTGGTGGTPGSVNNSGTIVNPTTGQGSDTNVTPLITKILRGTNTILTTPQNSQHGLFGGVWNGTICNPYGSLAGIITNGNPASYVYIGVSGFTNTGGKTANNTTQSGNVTFANGSTGGDGGTATTPFTGTCTPGKGGTTDYPTGGNASGYGCGGGGGYGLTNGGTGSGGYARISWNKYWDTASNSYKLAGTGAGGGGASGNVFTYTIQAKSRQMIPFRIGRGGRGAYVLNNTLIEAKKGGNTVFGDIKALGGSGGASVSVNSDGTLKNGTGGGIPGDKICTVGTGKDFSRDKKCIKGAKGSDAKGFTGGEGANFAGIKVEITTNAANPDSGSVSGTVEKLISGIGGEGGIPGDNSSGKSAENPGYASGGGGAAIRDMGQVNSTSQANITKNENEGGRGSNGKIILEWWE